MASDVAAPLGMPSPLPQPYAGDSNDEIAYEKIISLRDTVWSGQHPRYKPPPPGAVHEPPRPALQNVVNGQAPERGRQPPPPASGAARGAPSQSRTQSHTSASAASHGQIDAVLLTKSEALIQAEMQMKRARIEERLKNEFEQRNLELRMGIDVKNGHPSAETDVDLDEAIKKAGVHVPPINRPDSPKHPGSRKESSGTHNGQDVEMPDYVEKRGGAPRTSRDDTVHSFAPEKEPPIEGRHGFFGTRAGQTDMAAGTSGEHISPRSRANDAGTARNGKARATSPSQLNPPGFTRESGLPATPPERVYSPPQPRYSATSQVRSPAAPQPVRPANVARVEPQEMAIDLEDDAGRPYSPGPLTRGRTLARPGSVVFIKPEPMASPSRRESIVAGRRPISPDRISAAPSRASHYAASRPSYEYHPAPASGYYYPPPHPAYARHPYEPYPRVELDPYAYPPVEYARPYPAGYPPPQAPPPFYPPRPVYDDYSIRYASRPPPPPPIRQPSRLERRSASPPAAYDRGRRSSLSASPARQVRPRDSPPPRSPNARYRAAYRSPSPAARANSAAYRPPEPQMVLRRPDPYHHPYGPPPPDPYYGERLAYHPGPPERHSDEPRFVRAESAMVPREADPRSYRERQYYPPPPIARYPPPPPPSTYHASYPPTMHEYPRAPSRALMGPPPEVVEYAPRPPGSEYYRRGSVIPDGREVPGRASVRPEEALYAPRQQSVRPEPLEPGMYDERDRWMRQASVRPAVEGSRYRETMPPPGAGSYSERVYNERDRDYER